MLFPGGMRLSEHSTPTLASVLMDESFTPWMRFRIYDESVVELGDGAGVIVYRVEAEREGQEVFRAFCSSIWRRRASPEEDGDGEGGWEMVVHQQTLM